MFELNGPSPVRFDRVDQLASVVEDLGERVPAFHDCLDARSPDEEVAYDESPIGRLLAFGEVSGLRDLSHDLAGLVNDIAGPTLKMSRLLAGEEHLAREVEEKWASVWFVEVNRRATEIVDPGRLRDALVVVVRLDDDEALRVLQHENLASDSDRFSLREGNIRISMHFRNGGHLENLATIRKFDTA